MLRKYLVLAEFVTNLGEIQGGRGESKAKPAVLGKVSLNLAELASKTKADTRTKLPISLQVAGAAMEATLSVSFESFCVFLARVNFR